MALFEIGRQARQPLYWISTILLFLGGVGLMAMDSLGSSQVPRNAPSTLAMAVVFMNLPYVVIMAALAGDAAVRDGRSGFQPILQATPIRRWQHVLGRFLGVQAATVVAGMIGFGGLLAGSAAPWIQASAMGPITGRRSRWSPRFWSRPCRCRSAPSSSAWRPSPARSPPPPRRRWGFCWCSSPRWACSTCSTTPASSSSPLPSRWACSPCAPTSAA
ncbi:ABC transporter permease [Caulobacter flavus]|uniref:ABC transporter permease n=1 Tax=Caulobacter flavus TaxID=1679497 RepID=UPI001FD5368F|nr:ABC transporter permease [Caulobacter flavus]